MATIMDTAARHERLATFAALLRKTELANVLGDPGPFTVFAPTDEAFDDLPSGEVEHLAEDEGKLAMLLAYHVVPGRFTSEQAARMAGGVTTIEGSDLRITDVPAGLTVNGARVVQPDIAADNGVIHAIDRVLLPLDDMGNVVVGLDALTMVMPPPVVVAYGHTSEASETEQAGEGDQ